MAQDIYYIREPSSSDVYVCWRDNDCVTVLSNAYPGHSDGTARRASKDTSGSHSVLEVPLPSTIKYYNKFMGGVDKSDQYISYHRILRQTKRYWKTIFFIIFLRYAQPTHTFFTSGCA